MDDAGLNYITVKFLNILLGRSVFKFYSSLLNSPQ